MAKVLRQEKKFPDGELGMHRKKLKGRWVRPAFELFGRGQFVYSKFSIHGIIAEAIEGLYGRSANLPEGR
ncbi:hypothetical protein [Paenibacillus sp. MMS20-IR301]|uniref:hypothetical protein n=1 Tax=Paenibacillus sp. MMS20-IR301 TaxID=2895946 RepID=UPI0037C8F0D2